MDKASSKLDEFLEDHSEVFKTFWELQGQALAEVHNGARAAVNALAALNDPLGTCCKPDGTCVHVHESVCDTIPGATFSVDPTVTGTARVIKRLNELIRKHRAFLKRLSGTAQRPRKSNNKARATGRPHAKGISSGAGNK